MYDELEKSKFNKQFRDQMLKNRRPKYEIKDKSEYDAYAPSQGMKEFIGTEKVKEGRPKYEEEKRRYDYSSIDLSNKKDSFHERSAQKTRKEPAFTDERDKFKRVYNFADDQYRYADEGQDLESREEEKMDKAKFDRLARKNQGYYVKRHLDPDSNVEQEEIVEIRDLTVKSRDTQTPTRKVVDEGIQHDKQAASLAKSKFGSGRLGQRESEDAKSIHVEHEHERVPISTVKKRETPDSEEEANIFDNASMQEMEYDDIVNMIKGNESIQKKIINDPDLRERLYEKFSGMKPSASDQTLPNSFWSSKHMGDRRTQGQTNPYHTPLKSEYEEDKESVPRFTQFAHSELVGRGGTIYDEGTAVPRSQYTPPHGREEEEEEKMRKSQYSSREIPRVDKQGENFSFLKGEKRRTHHNISEHFPQRPGDQYSNTVELDDNENELITEGEENIERKYLKSEEDKEMSRLHDKHFGSAGRRNKLSGMHKRTSQYERKYEKSPSKFDSKSLKAASKRHKPKLDIQQNANQLLGDREAGMYSQPSVEGEGESEGAVSHRSSQDYERQSSHKKTMKALNKKYSVATEEKKRTRRPKGYPEKSETPRQHKHTKYLQKKSEGDEGDFEQEEQSDDGLHKPLREKPSHRPSKSGVVSYKSHKYSEELKSSDSQRELKERKRPAGLKERKGKGEKEPLGKSYSDEQPANTHERDSDEIAQDTPHEEGEFEATRGKGGDFGKRAIGGTKSASKHKYLTKRGKISGKTKGSLQEGQSKPVKKYGTSELINKEQMELSGKQKRGSGDERSQFEGEFEEDRSVHHAMASSQHIQPYDEDLRESMEYHQDEYVQGPREFSDYYHSRKDMMPHQRELLAEDAKRSLKDLGSLTGTPEPSKLKRFQSPSAEESKDSTLKSRKKSKYRETKEKIRSKRKEKTSSESEAYSSQKSGRRSPKRPVELDLGEGEEGPDMYREEHKDQYNRFIAKSYESEESKGKSSSDKEHKTLKDYEKLKQRKQKEAPQGYEPKRKHKTLEPGLGEGEEEEFEPIEGGAETQRIRQMKSPSGSKGKAQKIKGERPSKKHYDLKERIKAGKSASHQLRGEGDLEEIHGEQEESEGQEPMYEEISDEGKDKKPIVKGAKLGKKEMESIKGIKTTRAIRGGALKQGSDEDEAKGYSDKQKQEL